MKWDERIDHRCEKGEGEAAKICLFSELTPRPLLVILSRTIRSASGSMKENMDLTDGHLSGHRDEQHHRQQQSQIGILDSGLPEQPHFRITLPTPAGESDAVGVVDGLRRATATESTPGAVAVRLISKERLQVLKHVFLRVCSIGSSQGWDGTGYGVARCLAIMMLEERCE